MRDLMIPGPANAALIAALELPAEASVADMLAEIKRLKQAALRQAQRPEHGERPKQERRASTGSATGTRTVNASRTVEQTRDES